MSAIYRDPVTPYHLFPPSISPGQQAAAPAAKQRHATQLAEVEISNSTVFLGGS